MKAESSDIARLGAAIAAVEGVSEVYSVAGDEDLVALVRVRDHEAVATVVTEHIATIPGVGSTRTLIAFRAYSEADRQV